jgi:hypothetical protein
VLGAIKFIGVTIAAIWFGGAVFFTFFAAPAFFADPIKTMLPAPYNGQTAQYLLERYYVLHYLFGTLALMHLVFDWIYTGKTMNRLHLGLLVGALVLSLFAGKWMHPKLEQLHQIKYSEFYQVEASVELKKQAENSFGVWHGISQMANLLLMGGLWMNLWLAVHPKEGPKYLGSGKFNIDKHF